MRGIATLLSVVGYMWCAVAGIYAGYTAAVTMAALNFIMAVAQAQPMRQKRQRQQGRTA